MSRDRPATVSLVAGGPIAEGDAVTIGPDGRAYMASADRPRTLALMGVMAESCRCGADALRAELAEVRRDRDEWMRRAAAAEALLADARERLAGHSPDTHPRPEDTAADRG